MPASLADSPMMHHPCPPQRCTLLKRETLEGEAGEVPFLHLVKYLVARRACTSYLPPPPSSALVQQLSLLSHVHDPLSSYRYSHRGTLSASFLAFSSSLYALHCSA